MQYIILPISSCWVKQESKVRRLLTDQRDHLHCLAVFSIQSHLNQPSEQQILHYAVLTKRNRNTKEITADKLPTCGLPVEAATLEESVNTLEIKRKGTAVEKMVHN